MLQLVWTFQSGHLFCRGTVAPPFEGLKLYLLQYSERFPDAGVTDEAAMVGTEPGTSGRPGLTKSGAY